MSTDPKKSDDLTGEAARELERCVGPFEAAWEAGRKPDLDAYLPASALRPVVLAELVLADLEYRLKAGESARVEDYLRRYPELGPDRRLVLRLITAEYEFRRRRQAPPAAEEFVGRFPQYETELRACLPPPAAVPTPPFPGAAAEAPPPSRLGNFELLEVVGRGGFGVVYRARDTQLDRVVAVKVPRPGALAGPDDVDRFLREARSAAQLRHPGIVTVHEAGRAGETCFLVSEFVPGQTLA